MNHVSRIPSNPGSVESPACQAPALGGRRPVRASPVLAMVGAITCMAGCFQAASGGGIDGQVRQPDGGNIADDGGGGTPGQDAGTAERDAGQGVHDGGQVLQDAGRDAHDAGLPPACTTDGTSCDDGDPCTLRDACSGGVCAGAPVACAAPPASTCIDANTLRTYSATGTCSAGSCTYASSDETCPVACSGGACSCWTISTVDSGVTSDSINDVGWYTSLALDASGGIHISYYDFTHGDLKYAYRPSGGSWTTTTVDSGTLDDFGFAADVGSYSSLAVDGSGAVNISYHDRSNDALKYAYEPSGGSWSTVQVEAGGSDFGTYTSLALDSSGDARVAFTDGASVFYAVKLPGSLIEWTDAAMTDDDAQYTSLALDASGGIHIGYYDALDGRLQYMYSPAGGTAFTSTTVDAGGHVGTYTSLAVDASGAIHISYYDSTNADSQVRLRARRGIVDHLHGRLRRRRRHRHLAGGRQRGRRPHQLLRPHER